MSERPSHNGVSGSTKRSRRKPPCPVRSSLGGEVSVEANRRAAAILEVLGGVRTPSEAAQVLKISVTHYYVLERKALRGLLSACQPQPKGARGPSAEQELVKLRRQLDQCRRECMRQAALVRATQRAVGLPTLKPGPAGDQQAKAGKHGKRRRATVRALQAADVLRKNSSGVNPAAGVERSSPEHAADDQSRRTDQEQHGGTQG